MVHCEDLMSVPRLNSQRFRVGFAPHSCICALHVCVRERDETKRITQVDKRIEDIFVIEIILFFILYNRIYPLFLP